MVRREVAGAQEVLQELVGQRRSEEEGGLWRSVRLDWVRNWDQSCQTAVLLSRLEHTGRPHQSSQSFTRSAGLEDLKRFSFSVFLLR